MAKRFFTPIDLGKFELQNAVIQNLGGAPGSPAEGQLYYNTGDDNLYVYTTAGWVDLTVQGGGISYAVPSATINAGDSASAGISTDVLRSDAQFAVATGTASSISGSNAEGTSSNLARADHDHALGSGVVGTTQLAAGVRLDTINAPSASVALNSQKITGLADGQNAGDAVNLGQLQTAQQGLDAKASVRAATTASITIASDLNVADQIDGVTLADGDRVLVKNQGTASQNGIYIAGASPARAADMNAWSEVPNAYVWVEEGTNQADTAWVTTANAGGTLDSTSIPWVLFSSAGSLVAGAGLTKTGDQIDIATADTSMTINSDSIQLRLAANGGLEINTGVKVKLDGSTLTLGASGLKVTDSTFQPLDADLTNVAALAASGFISRNNTGPAMNARTITGTSNRLSVSNGDGVAGNPTLDIDSAYVGQTSITTLGTITTGVWTGTDIAVADGGTGSGTASGARGNLVAAGYYSSATHGAGTSISITAATHGLRATRGLIVQTVEESTGEQIEANPVVAANGDVTVNFGASQGANSIRVTIVG